jgi:glycosyltransferase involved in cell wall biosynthesis
VRLMTWLEKISFNFADHVTTINEPIQELLAGRGLRRSKSTVIMNVADESRFLSADASAIPEASAAPGQFIMMYHGTITAMYGLDVAIEALAIARDEMPGAELWVIGFGPQEDHLKRLVVARGLASRVKFIGPVAPADMPAWLRACHVGLLPMRRDVLLEFAFPNKLGEYLVMGKSIIVSRLRTLRHYFTEQALAFVEPEDREDLARQMARLYHDSELRRALVSRARAEYAPIRWDVMKERYLQVIDTLARRERHALDPAAGPETTVLAR